MIATSAKSARLRKIKTLNAKSDTELAKLGIKREDIVHHEFRDLYYIKASLTAQNMRPR
jgi:hypothetical protein